jgi:hypothetical protein
MLSFTAHLYLFKTPLFIVNLGQGSLARAGVPQHSAQAPAHVQKRFVAWLRTSGCYSALISVSQLQCRLACSNTCDLWTVVASCNAQLECKPVSVDLLPSSFVHYS